VPRRFPKMIYFCRCCLHLSLFAVFLSWPAMSQTGVHAEAGDKQRANSAAEAALADGVKALRSGDAAHAVASFTAATEAGPRFAEAWFNLGLALQQTGNAAGSQAALQKAIALKPDLRGAHLFLGIEEYQGNRFDKAEAALRQETELNPLDAKAWMWLGVNELAEAHAEDAARALDTAARLEPDDADVLYHRGRAHLLVSQGSYEKMFRLDPDSYRVHEVLAQADAEADRTADAISEYSLALQRAPREAGLHEALGDLYWTGGKMELAGPEYLEELQIDPHSVTANYKLGAMRAIAGDAPQAIEPLQRAVTLDPGFDKAYYYLGRAYIEMGRDSEGVTDLERASKAPGDETLNTLAWYQLARVYRRAHRTAEADAALAQFRQLRSQIGARQEAKRAAQIKRRGDLPVLEQVPADAADGQQP
jgi:tetratricopeptide (TPR) repeat protein